MKISKVEIHNYRSINRVNVNLFEDITLIVGKNNIGKSNILKAIEIFFEWLNKGEVSKLLKKEDFRKNSSRILISITFSEVNTLLSTLETKIKSESNKKRVNQQTLKYYETLFHTFKLVDNRFHEFCLTLTIPRSDYKGTKLEIKKSTSKTKKRKFETIQKKRNLAKKFFLENFKQKQKEKSDWYNYEWLRITQNEDGQNIIHCEDESFPFSDEDIKSPPDNKTIKNNILEYIKSTQKFFYVPAYRGGKSERDEAINKLFDLIIEDLVKPKRGSSKDYDTVTDAIWGTGKNSNIYNLKSVIEARLSTLTNDLKDDSISEIKEIEFKPFPNEEIRRRILKIMLGSTNIYLNDGIKTAFESKGTGIQSSFMITLMKALSVIEFEEDVSIILVIEEPEAFAHPQLIREIIHKISLEFSNNLFQFIVSTHSPVIVNYVNSNKIQRLSLQDDETQNITNLEKLKLKKENWSLINRVSDVKISEIVFSDLVIFVEGEGDKIVFEKLLRIALPNFYSKISIVSLSGNGQIFKIFNLLRYYNINWMMILDKDSFVEKGLNHKNLQTEKDLDSFFEKYQIGPDYQDSYKQVLKNSAVSKIQISVQSANIKYGRVLDKIGEILPKYESDKIEQIKKEIFDLASQKLNDEVFPENEALSVAQETNIKMQKFDISFYMLTSDLEGLIINENTLHQTKLVYEKYFRESFDDFCESYKNASKQEEIRALRKKFGSKTHTLGKSSKSKKKPHIPIEIITEFIESHKEEDSLKESILNSFDILPNLIESIKNKLGIDT